MNDDALDLAHNEGFLRGYIAGIQGCVKVLEDLRARTRSNEASYGIGKAIDALKATAPSPVASSPVGGEQ